MGWIGVEMVEADMGDAEVVKADGGDGGKSKARGHRPERATREART